MKESRKDALRPRLVLASASPRRRELLARLDCAYDCLAADIDEEATPGLSPLDLVVELARRKAETVFSRLAATDPGRGAQLVVLGADTVVVLGDPAEPGAVIIGKPRDEEDARRMLGVLSGRSHGVLTALALVRAGAVPRVEVEVTEVAFRRLDAAQIEGYLRTGEALDKAGAYGIQGAGCELVESIRGCFFNVVGLPLATTAALLGDLCGPRARPCDCSTHLLQRGRPDCGVGARGRR